MTNDELIAQYLTTHAVTKCETRNGLDSNATRARKNDSQIKRIEQESMRLRDSRIEQLQDDNFNRAN